MTRLVESTSARLVGIGRSHGIPDQIVKELVQTVWLLLWRKRREIRKPEVWLAATMRGQCLMYWRKRRREDELKALVSPGDGTPVEAVRPEQEGWEARHDLSRVAGEVSPQHLWVAWLMRVEGYTAPEAAARLGYSPESVRQIARRAMAQMRVGLVHRGRRV
jgi:RNA polymerase sigma factor (sigma-70 family)